MGVGAGVPPLVRWLRRLAACRLLERPPAPTSPPLTAEQAEALALDAADELGPLRRHFRMPDGVRVYLCGHSLGLLPALAAELVREELKL